MPGNIGEYTVGEGKGLYELYKRIAFSKEMRCL